jgi:hypothetical protein
MGLGDGKDWDALVAGDDDRITQLGNELQAGPDAVRAEILRMHPLGGITAISTSNESSTALVAAFGRRTRRSGGLRRRRR